ncbi:phosphoenolpyruvate-protein phosphotransferase [Clostridium oryzae]|uniref:Phosphoenolpyruvate-protein phosphotransferase n=2 Tax=Clostridium oryzae TaxID=1450648 RepID=A0A1V4ICF4_9CLOT|nr:phosphoenolpyruvate-protein phosphotransferase [Clostridium oryzae]
MKKGIAASSGYAIGRVFLKVNEQIVIAKKTEIDKEEEKRRLEEAIEKSRQQLLEIKERTASEIGEGEAEVFESHLMILDDPEFIGAAMQNIESEQLNAEIAVNTVMDMYLDMFSDMEDEYMRERAADLRDVKDRLLRNLTGSIYASLDNLEDNTVVVAHDLTPSDTAQLDKNKVIGFLTDIGGRTSHSAIMARTLEIPAVVGIEDITLSVKTGDIVIVDGVAGKVIINPDKETIKIYEKKKLELQKEKLELKKLANTKTVTKAGKEVIVAGNIGAPQDVHKVIENGGEGIGLFRTEFLYMDRGELPSEEEQYEAYKYVAEKMEGKPVVIRTLDIGGDKKLSYLPLQVEMNPFLGYRAIRLCLDRQDIFKTQLRAILRASAHGRIQIMFPMISSLEETIKAKDVLKECMKELSSEGKSYNENIEIGIMIEIPAAAIIADELAKHVDFFSIGTNDLIQYTVAVDRMNESVSYLYNPMHPAVLRLIRMAIDAAHKEGKWCGMCGEMAGDEEAITTLLEYGLDEFSMSASSILKARQIIINN